MSAGCGRVEDVPQMNAKRNFIYNLELQNGFRKKISLPPLLHSPVFIVLRPGQPFVPQELFRDGLPCAVATFQKAKAYSGSV